MTVNPATQKDDGDPEMISSHGSTEGDSSQSPHDFDRVYRETAPFVLRSLKRLVPMEAVDDALQDVYLTVLRRLPEFEQRSKLSTWVYGIVLRVASDHRRSQKRRLKKLDAVALEPSAPSDSPERNAQNRSAVRLLHRVLEEMREELREVLLLSDIEELPGSEVAAILELNQNTMYSRLRAARSEFESLLEKQRGEGP